MSPARAANALIRRGREPGPSGLCGAARGTTAPRSCARPTASAAIRRSRTTPSASGVPRTSFRALNFSLSSFEQGAGEVSLSRRKINNK